MYIKTPYVQCITWPCRQVPVVRPLIHVVPSNSNQKILEPYQTKQQNASANFTQILNKRRRDMQLSYAEGYPADSASQPASQLTSFETPLKSLAADVLNKLVALSKRIV